MNDKEIVLRIQTLEKLKGEVLIDYLNEINLDEEIDLYDKMINHFVLGDLDKVYDNILVMDLNDLEKDKILKIVHKYQNLCFYDKNPNFWIDSVDGISVTDYNMITYQIFDNFDFLLKLYLHTNEDTLKILNNYDKSSFFNKTLSTVENIRRNFINDEVIFNVFKNISNKNKLYNIFTANEIRTLLYFAEGTLYSLDDKVINITDPLLLGAKIYRGMNTNSLEVNDNSDLKSVESKLREFFLNEDGFDEAVESIYYDYQEKLFSSNMDFNPFNVVSDSSISLNK